MAVNVAIVGATGAVGQELLKVLAERDFPVRNLRLLASARSSGKRFEFRGQSIAVEELTKDSFKEIQIAFFSAGGSVSREFAPAAVAAKAVVVDNTSAFRMKEGIPLVVPEVNAEQIHRHSGLIAVPNCSTIIMTVPLWPLHRANRVKRVIVSTYQAVSGAGAWGLHELESQMKSFAQGQPIKREKFPHQVINNLFSHNTAIAANGYNEEENKMAQETRKIFGDGRIMLSATCIRVPVPRAHSEAVNIEFERPITVEEVRDILSKAPGVKLVDDREANHFPMPLEASGQDDVLVGRIRQDISRADGRGIEIFISGDQLRKGAATNAVQIAERLVQLLPLTVMNWRKDSFEVTDDRDMLDFEFIIRMLGTSYWAAERSADEIRKSWDNSIPFSVWKDGTMIGFARAVTDRTTFSWIADVMIDPDHRGRGVGTYLMRCIMDHPEIRRTKVMLGTRDAHAFYETLGFTRRTVMRKMPEMPDSSLSPTSDW